jgi:hypothetical protein
MRLKNKKQRQAQQSYVDERNMVSDKKPYQLLHGSGFTL